MDTAEKSKQQIIQLFIDNVKGLIPPPKPPKIRADHHFGHWLETQMNIKPNASNKPDLLGFEMKNNTSSGKTSFGDWSADFYIFQQGIFGVSRKTFLQIFGQKNQKKSSRWSWSGKPCPNIKGYNDFGQKLEIDSDSNILAIYSYTQDKRLNKESIVPDFLRKENLILAQWDAVSLKAKVEQKFNQNGWFKCYQDKDGSYQSIGFGKPIDFNTWLDLVKEGEVFFDSGMYHDDDKPNTRPYSQWRANNAVWEGLIIDRYPAR